MKTLRNQLVMRVAAALACTLLLAAQGRAQSPTDALTSGLKAPNKVIVADRDYLLVAEAGDGPNVGRVSIIDRKTGARRTLIGGLPSAINQSPAGPEPSGPSGLALRGRTLYVLIGQGNVTVPGPAPGSEVPNPNPPASPIFSSVLAVTVSTGAEDTTEGFTLSAADQTNLKNGNAVTLTDTRGNTLNIRLVADFADHTPAPRPDVPANVKPSNPFGIALAAELLYVADAGQNLVRAVGIESGSVATIATFPPQPNPLPFGPPVYEAVPDNVRLFGDQLLVPFLTGFPFPQGRAEIRKIDLVAGGSGAPFITGLTTAIDVVPIRVGDEARFLTLEFSTNMTAQPPVPGRLSLYETPSSARITIANNLVSPTSMARDTRRGDVYVTEIFTGRVIRITGHSFFVRQHYKEFLLREPDASGWAFWEGQISQCGADEGCQDRKRVDVSRAFFFSGEFIAAHPELDASLRGTTSYNRAFVKQCYFTYLQRPCDPEICDPVGFNFWLNKLNSRLPSTDADYSEMIRAFIISGEYRARLGLN